MNPRKTTKELTAEWRAAVAERDVLRAEAATIRPRLAQIDERLRVLSGGGFGARGLISELFEAHAESKRYSADMLTPTWRRFLIGAETWVIEDVTTKQIRARSAGRTFVSTFKRDTGYLGGLVIPDVAGVVDRYIAGMKETP